MYLLLIFLPLIAAFLSNRWLGIHKGPLLSIFLIFIGFILTLIIYIEIGFNSTAISLNLGQWFNILNVQIEWNFLYDSLTISILLPIYFISFLVQFYSNGYMEHDPHKLRFFSYLSLFTFFMLILVTADNFLFLFLGWEGVGLISYLLINFWYTRILANYSALKAFYVNRVGDLTFQLALIIILNIFNDLSLSTLSNLISYIDSNYLILILILFIFGAMAKSGQYPLHIWLPNA
jgi:NADH-ubiquinone oxidoreductase chain 5